MVASVASVSGSGEAALADRSGQDALAARGARLALPGWQYFIVPLIVLAVWEVAVAVGWIKASLVPAPHTVVASWYTWIFGATGPQGPYSGTWAQAALSSAVRVLAGFAIAAMLGIVVGLSTGWFRLPRMLFQPLIDILRPVPITAWVPFAVVFFGIQPTASIFLIALGAFFPIALNSAAGAVRTPRVLVRSAQMLGTEEHALIWRVVFPSALPSIVSGLRVGLALAWVLVIVSEMVAVKSGLGFSLWDAYYFNRIDIIVAAMFSVGLLGFISDRLLQAAAGRVTRWAADGR